jgi:hypothetical protein
MLVFIALFTVIDGFFVSNFAGKTALAAVNLVWPIFMMLSALGFVFGTGGSALVAAQIGAGKKEYALGIFTISDLIHRHEDTTSEEREQGFDEMMLVALETAVRCGR